MLIRSKKTQRGVFDCTTTFSWIPTEGRLGCSERQGVVGVDKDHKIY